MLSLLPEVSHFPLQELSPAAARAEPPRLHSAQALGLEAPARLGPERSDEAARLENPSPASLGSLSNFTFSFLNWSREAAGRCGWSASARSLPQRASLPGWSPPRAALWLFVPAGLAASPRARGTACRCLFGARLEKKRVRVSNGAVLLPCAFPAAEQEAEAGLRGQSGALSGGDELFGDEAVLPSAAGAEEEREG